MRQEFYSRHSNTDRWPSARTNKEVVPLELFINSIQRFRTIITLQIPMCVFQTQQSYWIKTMNAAIKS